MRIFGKYFLKIIIVFLLIICLTLSFNLFHLNQKLLIVNQELSLTSSELENTKENLDICYADRGKLLSESAQDYSFNEFLISSPLFEGKQIEKKIISYKGNEIKKMVMTLSQDDERLYPITITVYDYLSIPPQNRVQFDDYYNTYATSHDESVVLDDYRRYRTAKGYIMIQSQGSLSLMKEISSMHAVYVNISQGPRSATYPGTEEVIIKTYNADLREVADTIVF